MFDTIMRTAPISGLRRGHLTAGFVPWLRVGSFRGSDPAGCTIVTIEPPNTDRRSAGPYIYAGSTHTRTRPLQSLLAASESMVVCRTTPPITAPVLASAEVLANNMYHWRGSPLAPS